MFCISLRESLCTVNMGDSFLFVVQIMYIVFPCDIFALSVRGLNSHKYGSNIKRCDRRNWVILECSAFTRQKTVSLGWLLSKCKDKSRNATAAFIPLIILPWEMSIVLKLPVFETSLISWGVSAMTSFCAHCVHNA